MTHTASKTADQLVADDVRLSYPEMTDAQAVAHAIYTVDPTTVDYYDDDPVTAAYREVLLRSINDQTADVQREYFALVNG